MKLSDLQTVLADQVVSLLPGVKECDDPEITSIHYDSRKVVPGGLFVAIAGYECDGHIFVDQAVHNGAAAVLVEQPVSTPVPAVQVTGARPSLALVAAHFYGHPTKDLVVIGITGTNGKTTTTYLIENMLIAQGHKVGVIGTINYRYQNKVVDASVTTPEAPDLQRMFKEMRDSGVTHVVIEVSSHAIALRRIDGCELDVAVFTNLSQDHLDFHQDMITYWDIKKSLFTEILSKGFKNRTAKAVINQNDPRGEQLTKELSLPVIGVGQEEINQVYPNDITIGPKGMNGNLVFGGIKTNRSSFLLKFHSPLTGAFNLENILCAAGACLAVGVMPHAIRVGIEKTGAVPGRLERVENETGVYVYVDYAHTPDALKNVLKTLRKTAQGRLICIAGCGGDRDRAKRPLMGKIAMMLSDLVIFTSDNPRSEAPMVIIEDMLAGINNGFRAYKGTQLPGVTDRPGYVVEPDRRRAIHLGITAAVSGDTVLIAGKGHETYQIIKGRRFPFDDREEALKALSRKQDISPHTIGGSYRSLPRAMNGCA